MLGPDAERWFDLLGTEEMRPFLKADPRLALKPMVTYCSRKWTWERRVKVLMDTYRFTREPSGLVKRSFLEPDGVVLANVPLPHGLSLTVRMRADTIFRKEGEIGLMGEIDSCKGNFGSLGLVLEQGPDGAWHCRVGVVQGRRGQGEEVTRQVTKAMFGLRPKSFMVFLAQEIARAFRCEALYGVGNGIQVYRSRSLQLQRKGRKVMFDYDGLWLEAGGLPTSDGWFELPLQTPRRSPEEMKPNKRSMYIKRYAMLDEISRQLQSAMTMSRMGPG